MKNVIVLSFLVLFGCSSTSVKKTNFIRVDYLTCQSINYLYSKKQLSKIESYFLHSQECGIYYMNVRIHKDTIVAFGPSFSILTDKIDKNSNDTSAPLEVTNINKEHCTVQFESGKLQDINITCQELEKML